MEWAAAASFMRNRMRYEPPSSEEEVFSEVVVAEASAADNIVRMRTCLMAGMYGERR
eukprot:CAMPEP_0194282272 /NCGR_PEP_ID=MMETSP0169-20130528/22791_1 /TAXON_ID=218684 /ORGANISM="Corethron pennatum, Strain L29A3" /LENGTH=56 /DNA_ID=CAMNT_0039027541 /DNA_START=78 /DNA_END=248 /DNA_ORIENTATION=-